MPVLRVEWICTNSECATVVTAVDIMFECDICGFQAILTTETPIFLPNRHCPECTEGKAKGVKQMGCVDCAVGICVQEMVTDCCHCGFEFPISQGNCCASCQETICVPSEHPSRYDTQEIEGYRKVQEQFQTDGEERWTPSRQASVATLMPPTSVIQKFCTHCGELRPAEAFGRSSRSKDGLRPYCKEYDRAASEKTKLKKGGKL